MNPDQLFIHLVSLSVYPFIAKRMIQAMFDQNEDSYNRFMQKRKKEICRFVFDSLALEDKTEQV